MGNDPKTGDGRTGGQRPEAKDCAQRDKHGTLMIEQPSEGWAQTAVEQRRAQQGHH